MIAAVIPTGFIRHHVPTCARAPCITSCYRLRIFSIASRDIVLEDIFPGTMDDSCTLRSSLTTKRVIESSGQIAGESYLDSQGQSRRSDGRPVTSDLSELTTPPDRADWSGPKGKIRGDRRTSAVRFVARKRHLLSLGDSGRLSAAEVGSWDISTTISFL